MAKMKKNNEIYAFWIKRYDTGTYSLIDTLAHLLIHSFVSGSGRNPQDIVVTEAMQKEMANLLSSTTTTNDVAPKIPNKEKAVGSNNDSDKMSSKLQQLKVLLFENELIELIRQEELHLGPLSDSINENQAINETIQKQIREIVNEINKQKEIQEIMQVVIRHVIAVHNNQLIHSIRTNSNIIWRIAWRRKYAIISHSFSRN